jgi:hypothetical protein
VTQAGHSPPSSLNKENVELYLHPLEASVAWWPPTMRSTAFTYFITLSVWRHNPKVHHRVHNSPHLIILASYGKQTKCRHTSSEFEINIQNLPQWSRNVSCRTVYVLKVGKRSVAPKLQSSLANNGFGYSLWHFTRKNKHNKNLNYRGNKTTARETLSDL